jgi:hypothetical protein
MGGAEAGVISAGTREVSERDGDMETIPEVEVVVEDTSCTCGLDDGEDPLTGMGIPDTLCRAIL